MFICLLQYASPISHKTMHPCRRWHIAHLCLTVLLVLRQGEGSTAWSPLRCFVEGGTSCRQNVFQASQMYKRRMVDMSTVQFGYTGEKHSRAAWIRCTHNRAHARPLARTYMHTHTCMQEHANAHAHMCAHAADAGWILCSTLCRDVLRDVG